MTDSDPANTPFYYLQLLCFYKASVWSRNVSWRSDHADKVFVFTFACGWRFAVLLDQAAAIRVAFPITHALKKRRQKKTDVAVTRCSTLLLTSIFLSVGRPVWDSVTGSQEWLSSLPPHSRWCDRSLDSLHTFAFECKKKKKQWLWNQLQLWKCTGGGPKITAHW